MATQKNNSELVSLLAAYFMKKYDAYTSYGNIISAYMQLPGLIAFYTGGIGNTTSTSVLRSTPTTLHLTRAGTPYEFFTTTGLRRIVYFSGTTDHFYAVDSAYNSILGTENTVGATVRGMTVMAWVFPTTAVGSSETAISKWNTSNQRSWVLERNASGPANLAVSGNGTSAVSATGTTSIAQNGWHFIAGRFTPSTEIKVWMGNSSGLETATNTTSIPASLHNSTARLAVAARNSGGTPSQLWTGYMTLIALCRASLYDMFVENLFDMTRPMFLSK